jgi:hypothetical protein
MQHAIENELSAKGQLDMEQQRLVQVENEIDMEREKVCFWQYSMCCSTDIRCRINPNPSQLKCSICCLGVWVTTDVTASVSTTAGIQVRQERDALEAMRVDFEHELQQAQTEVAKAQDALKTAEDRVRASEQVDRQKIISGVP